ncbi:MAG: hypothetical protein LUQ37_08675, partial [Methanoregulaceae archaeon]|nr:hypothetical protein [Methanoregulaceae archaeon]
VKEPDGRRAYITGKTGTELVIPKFFLHGEQLCYSTTRRARSGYFFHKLDKVVKYDIVLETRKESFNSYEDFKKRFDLMFITEDEIQNLWNGQSSQHGGKYIPKDFHGMGPKGKKVMADFLRRFQGINTTPRDVYNDKGYLNVCRNAYSHMGRDISISHLYGNRYVWYASEIAGCGNGRYGLVANKTTFLWLEDD